MDKLKLKQYMEKIESDRLAEVRNDFIAYGQEIDIDQNDVIDSDDISRSDANAARENELRKRVLFHESNLNVLKEISFAPCETVKSGAAIKSNEQWIVIAIPMMAFEFEGKEIEGISTEAPIYQAMKGKKAGDTYTFNGKNYLIEEVV